MSILSRVFCVLLMVLGSFTVSAQDRVLGTREGTKPVSVKGLLGSPNNRQGTVEPISEPDSDKAVKVLAIGRAPISNGDTESARKIALRAAYAEAVGRGVGIEVGSLTLIRNIKEITDFVTTKSRGVISDYRVLSEGVSSDNTAVYEVRIEATVSRGSMSDLRALDALKIYLGILGNPRILVTFPEYTLSGSTPDVVIDRQISSTTSGNSGTKTEDTHAHMSVDSPDPTKISPHLSPGSGVLSGLESSVAAELSNYGYRVLTSDSVLHLPNLTPELRAGLRRGDTNAILQIAKESDSDLVLLGVLKVSSTKIHPYGVDFESVTGEVLAKAMLTSSGELIRAFHRSVTRAHTSASAAETTVEQRLAKQLVDVLAWKIPEILVNSERYTELWLRPVSLDDVQRIKKAIENIKGVEAVRMLSLPTTKSEIGRFDVLTGYIRPEISELRGVVKSCFPRNKLEALRMNNFVLDLVLK